jgi:hypothetical protein
VARSFDIIWVAQLSPRALSRLWAQGLYKQYWASR